MNPKLVAIAGPQQGTTYPLSDESTSIGRDSSSWIPLTDASASRKHCLITRNNDHFEIADLKSRNGTFVNGIPIQKHRLSHGDRIELGGSSFLFLLQDEESPPSPLMDPALEMLSTTRFRVEDTLYLHPEKLLSALPSSEKIARALEALLNLAQSLQKISEWESLCRTLLQSVFQVVPAERGTLVLLQPGTDEIDFSYTGDQELRVLRVPVSRTIIRTVLQERTAFLSNDVFSDPKISDATKSLSGFKIASVIAVPMAAKDRILAVLILDTSDPGVRFDEDHLQFVCAIATIGTVALENHRYLKILENDHRLMIEDLKFESRMIGESDSMKKVYELIAKVAPTGSTVLIQGESGTGKELAARAIHWNSERVRRPFVVINCATLSETLLESDLFGHEKGAFTGAIAQKKGKLEIADGGTVFLDEVGDLAAPLQAKLLRVLQEREFERVGGTRAIKIDVRIIAATNKDLEEAVKDRKFREDLYYRLNVVQVQMPALRERKADIPLLATYFASVYGKKCGRHIEGISSGSRELLINYDWPGNVRELENVIERAVVLGSTNVILPEDLPEALLECGEIEALGMIPYNQLLRATKKRLIQNAFEQASGDHTEAARILGMHPNNLHRILRNLRIHES